MRKWLIVLAALCGTAVAQEMPQVIGYIPTQGGKVVLGSAFCDDASSKHIGYLQSDGGKIVQPLCWDMIDDEVFVVYADGDRYTYPFSSVRFTAAFDAWFNNRGNRT